MQENSENPQEFVENTSMTGEGIPEAPTPEYLQRKLYFLLEHLKSFHAELPETYQMRIPYELLTGLANSLLNDTIFEIVKGLMEIQHVTEKHLEQLRQQVETEHNIEVQEWMSKIHDEEELAHILSLMKIKHNQKMNETDIKLVLHLDQKVKDQQSTLERAGVPGFYVTDNPKDIKIQMHLLDFILRLSNMKFESK
ncbi:gonadal protein gdl [Lutzomyia longipalpis]|uniref:gonadal protein gdl n=1 Tax=Lutzomyia longipalpis TaxID=7200 RepID=UPI002483681B|nr:gonadal protein gdl [Lutzomyia longipalpis]